MNDSKEVKGHERAWRDEKSKGYNYILISKCKQTGKKQCESYRNTG